MEIIESIIKDSLFPSFTLFCIFVIFIYQEINEKIREAYRSFREWIKFRMQSNNSGENLLLHALGMNNEPDSWLEKDVIFHMFYFYKKVRSENIVAYKKASEDYYSYVKSYFEFKKEVLELLVFLVASLVIVISVLNSSELSNHHHIVSYTYYGIIVLIIFRILRGPKLNITNNTVTNLASDVCLKDEEKEIKHLKKLVHSI